MMACTHPRTKADFEAQGILMDLGIPLDEGAEIRIVPGDERFMRHYETFILKDLSPWEAPIKGGREVITVGFNHLKKAAPELLRHLLKLKITGR